MSAATKDAPNDLKDLEDLLSCDNKVKVAGKCTIYSEHRIVGDMRSGVQGVDGT